MRRRSLGALGLSLVLGPVALLHLPGCGASGAPRVTPPAEDVDGGWALASDPPDAAGADPRAGETGPLPSVIVVEGAPVALYPVRDAASAVARVGYRLTGSELWAHDATGKVIWQETVGPGTLFGGFDMDGDGWVDMGIVRTEVIDVTCGVKKLNRSWIDLVSGRTGQIFEKVVEPLADICWDNLDYGTQQWVARSVIFGAGPDLVFTPQYQTTGPTARNSYSVGKAFLVHFQDGAPKVMGDVWTPASPSFDGYAAAKLEPHGSGTKHFIEGHVLNGLVTNVDDRPRLVAFTSGRVVQYDLGSRDLVADAPFLTGNRTDLVGRNYGQVMVDPGDGARLSLVTGTPAATLFRDTVAGTMDGDPWAGIERHVTAYDLRTNAVSDRFVSYAHDNGDGNRYEGRTAYPAHPMLPGKGAAGRTIYDVYSGGHWSVVVTDPGKSTTALTVRDLYVWDVEDLDGDGDVDIVATPMREPSQPDVPGYYFAPWQTTVYRWDEATKTLVQKVSSTGVLPRLVASFSEAGTSNSTGTNQRVGTVLDGQGRLSLLGVTSSGVLMPVPLR